jgi:hypothetical protein
MEPEFKWHWLRAAHAIIFASGLVLLAGQASAHIIPWRLTGFGTCAKGPCLKHIDFSPTVPHIHLANNGRDTVVLCTGLKPKPSACSTSAVHR